MCHDALVGKIKPTPKRNNAPCQTIKEILREEKKLLKGLEKLSLIVSYKQIFFSYKEIICAFLKFQKLN